MMEENAYTVRIIKGPSDYDWFEVKRRALVTVGREVANPPTSEWKRKILKARHSPIRYLRYSFMLEHIPYWVACELRTHVHDMPYVSDFGVYIRSSRNDRQKDFDRNAARQDAPVNMSWTSTQSKSRSWRTSVSAGKRRRRPEISSKRCVSRQSEPRRSWTDCWCQCVSTAAESATKWTHVERKESCEEGEWE